MARRRKYTTTEFMAKDSRYDKAKADRAVDFIVPFGQGFKDMSPPTKELMKLVLEKRVAHGGHPVLRWMMDNVFIRKDPAGNIKPDKEKSTEKIDGAVAMIMALDRAMNHGMNMMPKAIRFIPSSQVAKSPLWTGCIPQRRAEDSRTIRSLRSRAVPQHPPQASTQSYRQE